MQTEEQRNHSKQQQWDTIKIFRQYKGRILTIEQGVQDALDINSSLTAQCTNFQRWYKNVLIWKVVQFVVQFVQSVGFLHVESDYLNNSYKNKDNNKMITFQSQSVL